MTKDCCATRVEKESPLGVLVTPPGGDQSLQPTLSITLCLLVVTRLITLNPLLMIFGNEN